MRGTITIDTNRCKGCELCTIVCPKHLIGIDETFTARGYRPARLNDPNGDCTGCLLCAVICPDVAITVYRATPPARATSSPRQAVTSDAQHTSAAAAFITQE